MKKLFFILPAMFLAFNLHAQEIPEAEIEETDVIISDNSDDLSSSLDEIIRVQQRLTDDNTQTKHFQSVWSRKGFFNISYNVAKLNSKEPLTTGMGINPESFKSSWGLGIQYGRNYSLLKNPIVNMVMINLDYIPLDLNVNHYKKGDEKYLYNSDIQNDGKFYQPWLSEKFEYNYGMSIGPSVTLAPFTKLGIKELDFLKFNVYYHIGYHVSLLQFKTKESEDANTSNNTYHSVMKDALKLDFGHGLTNCIGFNASWKSIGIGYEMRWASLKYMSMDKENFGSTKYKFNTPTSRVYIEVRM